MGDLYVTQSYMGGVLGAHESGHAALQFSGSKVPLGVML